MKRLTLSFALFGTLLLSACSGNSTVSVNSQTQSSSSKGVQVSVLSGQGQVQNVLAGSSSSSDLGISGYQVQSNKIFVTKFAGQSPSASSDSSGQSSGNQQNGSANGSLYYDANGNVIGANGSSTNGSVRYDANGHMLSSNGSIMYDANGNAIMRSTTNGSTNTSSRSSSSRSNQDTASAYSYVAGCDYSLLGSLGLSATCGDHGFLFPGLVGGQCPVSACMFNVDQGGKTPFGPL